MPAANGLMISAGFTTAILLMTYYSRSLADRRRMANALTSATREDANIQWLRYLRACVRDMMRSPAGAREDYYRQSTGWSIGRGYEADYLESQQVGDALRYGAWLKSTRAF